MTTIALLSQQELDAALTELPRWHVENGKLRRTYVFRDFKEAFSFMTHMALVAESQNHHPEWFNVYKTVVVDLTTHEASGITSRDLFLARAMERIAGHA